MSDLRLSQIWIYPIKSLGGISLTSAKVLGKGLQYDRRWMLVDSEGKFMTQRIYPMMALFKVTLHNDHLVIHHKGDTLKVVINQASVHPSSKVQIWDDVVSANEVSPAHSLWFSERLGLNCRLVYFPEDNERPVDPLYQVNKEQVSLADAYPFLIIGQRSLDDLNSRLAKPVSMLRFRPNFVFSGGVPYEEDSWKSFTIGSAQFAGVKPCSRCVLTTVNPETGEKQDEPLRTLSTYRKRENKIYFGQNLVALNLSVVNVGDDITLNNS
jgi:uncharacterized protein